MDVLGRQQGRATSLTMRLARGKAPGHAHATSSIHHVSGHRWAVLNCCDIFWSFKENFGYFHVQEIS